MNLGAHMSIAGGVHRALERGLSIGCRAVQLFVKSNTQWRAAPLPPAEVESFRALARRFDPRFILAHTSYLLNLASPDPALLAKSRRGFLEEMKRCDVLGIPSLVLHPGSHRGSGRDAGIRRVAESLNLALGQTEGSSLTVLIETTAGQGNTLGASFEEIAAIIGLIEENTRVGVCFDTCHAFAAGYDIRNRRSYEATLAAFDRAIGLDRLLAFHLNDSIRELGSRVDRHTHIGKGRIGRTAFSLLVRDRRFRDRPMVIETPKGEDLREDVENLALLRSLREGRTRRGAPLSGRRTTRREPSND